MSYSVFGKGLCLLFVLAAGLLGQPTFSVAGRVVNGLTGAPVSHALVKLSGWTLTKDSVTRSAKWVHETRSDPDGLFGFSGLPQGTGNLTASEPNLERSPEGQARYFIIGPDREGLVLKMLPRTAIEGKVTDGAGRTIQGVQIKAFVTEKSGGTTTLVERHSTLSDNNGHYRMWDLGTGRFHLKAVGRVGGANLNFAGKSFAPTNQGGSADVGIEMKPGQRLQSDFALRMQPAYRLLGTVKNLRAGEGANFELLRDREIRFTHRAAFNASDGSFEVLDVLPGSYHVRVTQGENESAMVAESDVQVVASDLSNLELRAFGGVEITVQVKVTGERPVGPPTRNRPDLEGACRLELVSSVRTYASEYEEERRDLKVTAVLPGEYSAFAHCTHAYATSIMSGSQNLMAGESVRVGHGAPPPVLSMRASRYTGRLEIETRGMISSALHSVLVVPNFRSAEGVRQSSLTFLPCLVDALAPGQYTLFAIKTSDFPLRDAQALQGLRNGVSVDIVEGETARAIISELAQ